MKMTKFVNVCILQGNYGQGWEDESCGINRKDMREELREYFANSIYPVRLIERRVLRRKYDLGEF